MSNCRCDGRVGEGIRFMSTVHEINDTTFATEVDGHAGAVVEKLAAEFAGRVKVTKLNVDQNPETMARFNVRSIPMLVFMKDGKVVGTTWGLQPAAALRERFAQIAA